MRKYKLKLSPYCISILSQKYSLYGTNGNYVIKHIFFFHSRKGKSSTQLSTEA